MMKRFGLMLMAVMPALAVAQPTVPSGFSVRRIAPLLDGQRSQLTAVDDPGRFGVGVVSATADPATGIVSFRFVENSGLVRSLGTTLVPPANFLSVISVRFTPSGPFGGFVHATITGDNGPDGQTRLVTVDEMAQIQTQFTTSPTNLAYAFDFAGDLSPLMVLLDGDGGGGTALATASPDYAVTVRATNSVPAGTNDTDVAGFRFDSTGNYGGGILLADSEDGTQLSTIWRLDNPEAGGTYSRISPSFSWTQRRYGDLDIVDQGALGGSVFVTNTVDDTIEQVDPNGVHFGWATGFAGIDALSIAPDGESMYVADLNGIWLIRPSGSEPGPVVLATDPTLAPGEALTGPARTSLRVIFNQPVNFSSGDVTILDGAGQPVGLAASGSGSQFMIIGLATPLQGNTYTITLADTVTSVATGEALDGDNDGIAGGSYAFSLTHKCDEDVDGSGTIDLSDLAAVLAVFGQSCN